VVLPISVLLQLICTRAVNPMSNNLNLIRSDKFAESYRLARTFLNRECVRIDANF
jgi:hypothetical protein